MTITLRGPDAALAAAVIVAEMELPPVATFVTCAVTPVPEKETCVPGWKLTPVICAAAGGSPAVNCAGEMDRTLTILGAAAAVVTGGGAVRTVNAFGTRTGAVCAASAPLSV